MPEAVALELGISLGRFYQLRTDYLLAYAQGHAETWSPGLSGGDHQPEWTAEVTALITKLLSSKPRPPTAPQPVKPIVGSTSKPTAPASAAGLSPINSPPTPATKKPPLNPSNAGKPAITGPSGNTMPPRTPGCPAVPTNKSCWKSSTTPPASTPAHGSTPAKPSYNPDAFTQLGAALHFYGVQLRYAPTPQAKGKIERRHDYWQKRLVPLLAADHIVELVGANRLLDQLVPHANQHEIHRELGQTPHAAHQQALAENRSVIRPAPHCPWWPYVWSQQTRVRVGDDGQVPVGSQRQPVDAPPRTTVIRCLRPDGDI